MRLVKHLAPKDQQRKAKGDIAPGQRYITPQDLGVPLYDEKRRMELRRQHLASYGKVAIH